MWDHLGQVTGGAPVGIGTRGPGEQQLEIDRRLAKSRLKQLKRELNGIHDRRIREVEQRNLDHFTVGLVGYTNAGKSTLFNRLTAGGAFAHDKLFATLSARIEEWPLGGGNRCLLSDTVGFIRNLPHHLVASFRSTLEETVSAQLLLILLDVSDKNAEMQLRTVTETLDAIGARDQPRLLLLNKMDRLADTADALAWINRYPDALRISAKSGDGVEDLTEVVREYVLGPQRRISVRAKTKESKALSFIEQRADVHERTYDGDEVELDVTIGRRQFEHLLVRGARLSVNGIDPHEALATIWPPEVARAPRRVPPHERFHPAP
jgi:GTP-binding protein HflX